MSVYTWTGLGQLEESIAAGRASAEIVRAIDGVSGMSMAARRDAALAELLATVHVELPEQGRTVGTHTAYLANNAVFNVRDYGDAATGLGVEDDTEFIQAAADAAEAAGGGTVYFPRGTYRITDTIVGASRVQFRGEPGAVIDFSELPTQTPAISFEGSRGTATTLTVDATEADLSLSVTSEDGFTVGGWALLYSTGDISSTAKKGELVHIKSLDPLTVDSPIQDSYATADGASIVPLTMIDSPAVVDLRFVASSNSSTLHQGVEFRYCVSPRASGCEFKYCHHFGVLLSFCAGGRIAENYFEDSLAAGFAYGIAVSRANHGVTIVGNNGRRMRHMVTGGGSATAGENGIPRHIAVVGNTANECDDAGFDMHAAEDVIFANNTVNGSAGLSGDTGIIFQGSRAIIVGNAITNVGASGIVVQLLSARHCAVVVANNTVRRSGLGGGSGSGIIVDAQGSWQNYAGLVIAGNLLVDCESEGSAAAAIYVDTGTSFNTRGVTVVGNVIVFLDDAISAHGIRLRATEDFVIANNNVLLTGAVASLVGIYVSGSSEGVIVGNTINGQDATKNTGVRVATGSDVTVTGNRMKDLAIGLLFDSDATDCVVGLNNTRSCTTLVQLSTGTGHTFQALPEISDDNGDAAASLTTGQSEATQVWNTPISQDRAVALSTSHVARGASFRIVRTAAATGAFNLNVGTGPLAALAAGEWCEVAYDGSAWILTAFGALS